MSTQEEVIRLKFEADTKAADEATRKLAALEAEAKSADQQFRSGYVTQSQYEAAMRRLGPALEAARAEVRATTAAVAALEAQVREAGTVAIGAATVNLGGLGRAAAGAAPQLAAAGKAAGKQGSALGFLLLSQAVEDAQYGFSGVVNNIPGIVMAMGGSTGLAGALSLGAVAANQMLKHWDELKATFADTSSINEAKAALDGLFGAGGGDALGESLKGLGERIVGRGAQGGFLDDLADVVTGGFLRVDGPATAKIAADGKQRAAERKKATAAALRQVKDLKHEGDKDLAGVATAAAKDLKGGGQQALDELVNKALGTDALKHTPEAEKRRKTKTEAIARELQAALAGDKDAYNRIEKLAEGTDFGRSIEKQWNKVLTRQGEEGEKEAKHLLDAMKKEIEDLNEQGQEAAAKALEDLSQAATTGTARVFGDADRDLLIQLRANGATAQQQIDVVQKRIKSEVLRLNPELAAFPAHLAEVVRVLGKQAIAALDEAMLKIQQEEHLTEQEVARRGEIGRQQRGAAAAEHAANEGFQAAVQRQHDFARQFNPNLPALTPAERQRQAERQRHHLEQLGIAPEAQKAIGRVFADPNAARRVPGFMQAMGQMGFDEKRALEWLPMMAARMGREGRNFDPFAAAGDAFNREMRFEPERARRAERAARREAQQGGFRSVAPAPPGGGFRSVAPAAGAAATQQVQQGLNATNAALVQTNQKLLGDVARVRRWAEAQAARATNQGRP